MKTETKEHLTILIDRNCKKDKHRPFLNGFGVTWCTLCGTLMKDCVSTDKETHLPVNVNEPILVK